MLNNFTANFVYSCMKFTEKCCTWSYINGSVSLTQLLMMDVQSPFLSRHSVWWLSARDDITASSGFQIQKTNPTRWKRNRPTAHWRSRQSGCEGSITTPQPKHTHTMRMTNNTQWIGKLVLVSWYSIRRVRCVSDAAVTTYISINQSIMRLFHTTTGRYISNRKRREEDG